jgi:hypothetical protein
MGDDQIADRDGSTLAAVAARLGDAMYTRMQRQGYVQALDSAFRASPKELGEAAIEAARKAVSIYVLAGTMSGVLEEAFHVCPECRAPWRLHWTYVNEGGERKRRYNTCGLTPEQLASKWLDRRTTP